MLRAVVALALAYLIGSLDFAVIVARLRGEDIYSMGSGNPGASNALRSMGKTAGALVLFGDLAKGVVGAAIGATLDGSGALASGAGLAAVVGHCYPVLHRFRGGKGAATFAGMLLWVAPWAGLGMVLVFGGVVVASRIASVGSIAGAALATPLAVWLDGLRGWALVWLVAAVLLVMYRHRGNIARLFRGAERKVVGE
ncbi:MAG TPA: glycerol-3-phosphate 1-O-acyltransferase PlsY [Acidimicrobiia bacterium]|nr:glycerol-3-phosphate 1-O-acyltransferase PlsY [Acidimicrobiia bacterium]